MPMKAKDASVATALLIHGYLRSNDDNPGELATVLHAIQQEVADWAENLPSAVGREVRDIPTNTTAKVVDVTADTFCFLLDDSVPTSPNYPTRWRLAGEVMFLDKLHDDGALPADKVSVGLTSDKLAVSRTPHNVESGAVALAMEAIDLSGPEAIDRLKARIDEAVKAREAETVEF